MESADHMDAMSVDEFVAMLKRSSLPTIVVEGVDDMIVYRHMEESLSELGVSVLPVGGRKKVLEIFSRRSELPNITKITFIADKDIWVHTGIPSEYDDDRMLLTDGYSIENDIYRDGMLWELLRREENLKFDQEVNDFLLWYALALSRYLEDASEVISLHPSHVLNPAVHADLLSLRAGESYPNDLHQDLTNDYQRILRGKSLMALFVRNTNYPGREARHNDKALMEFVAKRPGPLLGAIYSRVGALLSGECLATA